ncbi:MAG: hypothetical protein HC881_24230 [Leptolyngbyaceae cyanobacterium SL_7_1]|nr:hypothetical protein [Leptolyngbyaceae cyanobacterium SL_7_1]
MRLGGASPNGRLLGNKPLRRSLSLYQLLLPTLAANSCLPDGICLMVLGSILARNRTLAQP